MSSKDPENATFSQETVHRIFNNSSFKKDDTRISNDALKCTTEYLRIFTREAIWRSDQARQNARQGTDNLKEIKTSTPTSNVLEESDLNEIKANLKLDF